MNDNVLPFPHRMQAAIDETQWKSLQAEFYLDCYFAATGLPASEPQQLQQCC